MPQILELSHVYPQGKIIDLAVGPPFGCRKDIVQAIVFFDGAGKVDHVGMADDIQPLFEHNVDMIDVKEVYLV